MSWRRWWVRGDGERQSMAAVHVGGAAKTIQVWCQSGKQYTRYTCMYVRVGRGSRQYQTQ